MERDPKVLINGTYYLALGTAGVLVILFLLSLINVPQICLSAILVSFIMAGLGVAMGLMARNETKKAKLEPEAQQRLKVGLRFNVIFIGLHVFLFIIITVITLLSN